MCGVNCVCAYQFKPRAIIVAKESIDEALMCLHPVHISNPNSFAWMRPWQDVIQACVVLG